MHGDRKRCEWRASESGYPPYDPMMTLFCEDIIGPRR
jgi:hypothetical protein